jgi:predicted small lipoprotein YifL
MKRFSLILAVLSLAACGRAAPPEPPPLAPAASRVQTPPVYALIGHRQALDLTSQQVTALDSVGQE